MYMYSACGCHHHSSKVKVTDISYFSVSLRKTPSPDFETEFVDGWVGPEESQELSGVDMQWQQQRQLSATVSLCPQAIVVELEIVAADDMSVLISQSSLQLMVIFCGTFNDQ